MTCPHLWNLMRPGFLIPVFFLSFFPGMGQIECNETSVLALGGCFVSRSTLSDGMCNQAGLGRIREPVISIHHNQPFLLADLGVSTLSIVSPAGRGGFGVTLSTFGITGWRQTASWIGYGLSLHSGITAGVGLYIEDRSTREQGHHFGAGCALRIQVRLTEKIILGAHVMQPLGHMMISAGFSYTFFRTSTFHSDLHAGPQNRLQWSNGLETKVSDSLSISLGIKNAPYTISGGVFVQIRKIGINIAFAYCFDTGMIPASTVSYGWK